MWMLGKCKTSLINIPAGTTSRVLPLDVSINKLFKAYIQKEFEEHLDDNLEIYIENKQSSSQIRVLTTQWVGNIWNEI